MTTEPSFADKTPLSVYKEFFRKYFSFSGRASRYDYWAFYFMNFMVYLAFFVLSFINETFSILSTIYGVFIIIPSLALGVRRLHDINKSGWYLAIPLAVCLLFAVIAAVRAAANYAAGAPATGGFYAVVYTILFLVALYATFIYILYLFSKKAVNEGNRFGEVTEAPEYEGLSRKYLIFGWVMIIVFPILSVAIISAYSSSVTTYKANKTLDERIKLQQYEMTNYVNEFNGDLFDLYKQTRIQMYQRIIIQFLLEKYKDNKLKLDDFICKNNS